MIGELAAGGGIAVVALVIGHFEGYLMGTKVRNVSQLVFAPDGEQVSTLPCLCGHPVTMHREHGKSSCSAFDPAATGGPVPCACKFFAASPNAVPGSPRGRLEL